MKDTHAASDVAITGMAGRFPDALDVAAFWTNLRSARCSVRGFSDDELRRAHVRDTLLTDPNYVKAGIVLEGADEFDASFFGYTPREAELMDPQHRLFLEAAWAALENSGCNPEVFPGAIGIYASCGFPTYFLQNVLTNRDLLERIGLLQAAIGNEADSLPSTVAYKFNLRGPSVAVQTFCSSSLVAVHLACQSLLNYECDLALAGAAALNLPQGVGYLYQPGGILSPDGLCRSFDARAAGSIYGSGVGILVLKRLEEAVDAGDHIYAVIKGSAVNNDGSLRAGYTAPGVAGQSAVITEALAAAGVTPASISYVEAHGSATPLGDAIELAALLKAFRVGEVPKRSIALGSLKTNVGHLDRAAGVAGVIKVALALRHRELPPSLNFETPNPDVDLDQSPFYVNTRLTEWLDGSTPRRAAVSSFGLGGTNAHMVLEEAPDVECPQPSRRSQLLIWSAKTHSALEAATRNLLSYLRGEEVADLADIAFTLQSGRASFNHRRMLVCDSRADALAALGGQDAARVISQEQEKRHRPISFLFPGIGDHYAGMARGLYEAEPVFREGVDLCCRLLQPDLEGLDLRTLLFSSPPGPVETCERLDLRAMVRDGRQPLSTGDLHHTAVAQPAVFVIEYALAQLLIHWDLRPHSLIGYSVGEYAAACVAGTLALEDALRLVAARARLIEQTAAGAMLAVPLGASRIEPLLGSSLSLAIVNGPAMCVVAGPPDAIAGLEARLTAEEILCRRLPTMHGFHSHLMDPVLPAYAALARRVTFRKPQISFVSNVTGTWITPEQATDPAYWVEQMRRTVQFGEGARTLLRSHDGVFIEVGPGQSLASFVKQLPECEVDRTVVPAIRHALMRIDDTAFLLKSLGQLWLAGVQPDWRGFWSHDRRRRVSLPTYPFEHQRYWLEPGTQFYFGSEGTAATGKKPDIADWFYEPVWSESHLGATPAAAERPCVVIFADGFGIGRALGEHLAERADVFLVEPGSAFGRISPRAFTIASTSEPDYQELIAAIRACGMTPTTVVHLWTIGDIERPADDIQELGFYSLLRIARALGANRITTPVQLLVVSNGLHAVEDEPLVPAKATMLGPCRVIPQEYPQVTCRSVDVRPGGEPHRDRTLLSALAAETLSPSSEFDVCLRGAQRLSRAFRPLKVESPTPERDAIRTGGVYLITGGMGGVGLVLADYLTAHYGARVALIGRTPLPQRVRWDEWLAMHPEGDRTSRVLATLQSLEARGAEVLVLEADAGDEPSMARAIAAAYQQFGAIDGVIHAAGVTSEDSYRAIAELDRDAAERHFRPKVHGVVVLERVMREYRPEFCLVFSSLAAVLGGITLAAYSAANAFLDSFVARATGGRTRWLVVNWDTWKAHAQQPEGSRYHSAGATVAQFTMTPAEGVEAFRRAVSAREYRHLVHSTADLSARLDQWVRRVALRAGEPRRIAQAPRLYSRPNLATTYEAARGATEQRISRIWQQLLGIENIGVRDNYFDLGGNSLLALQLTADLQQEFGLQLSPVTIFEAPTIADLARLLDAGREMTGQPYALKERVERRVRPRAGSADPRIAVIGMAGRFPGARNLAEFWAHLRDGVESLTRISDDDLRAAGIERETFADPAYVRVRPLLEDIDLFDAAFFGYSPREAAIMDPQHRLFLETAWQTLEDAGYDPLQYDGTIGVFGGSNFSSYLLNVLGDGPDDGVDTVDAGLGNDRDSLTTKVSYKLNLKGPSFALQTFCSTSLVAVHLAAQSLRNNECDMALAGGVNIRIPQRVGYRFEEGGQESPDGHTRTFDAKARGTVFGDGVGMVLLKRFEDALADGDCIRAVIRGSAINNDGSVKVSYTAPSVEGQAEVVAVALADAAVDASTIDYVEAHGTATELGDPIEVAALTKAFRLSTDAKGYCALGSLKTNVGHLDRAAGVAGLIKTVLAIEHGAIPPTLHFDSPNPKIDLENSPFVVNTRLREWPSSGRPRRAGVSSLGVGGTNAHVVLEEAPAAGAGGAARPEQLLLLSARTPEALDTATANLARHFRASPDVSLADAAFTLHVGRRAFKHRRFVVCNSREQAIARLESGEPDRVFTAAANSSPQGAVFLLSGAGARDGGSLRALADAEPEFRNEVARCCTLLQPLLGFDLRPFVMQATDAAQPVAAARGRAAEPAHFVVEYALARLLIDWGVRPQLLCGWGTGECVAACLAGVLSLEQALALVAWRAAWTGAAPGPNTPDARQLRAILGSAPSLHAPEIPVACGVSGSWLTAESAADPDYWRSRMLDGSVSEDGIRARVRANGGVLLEIGSPGVLTTVLSQQSDGEDGPPPGVVPTLRGPGDAFTDVEHLLTAVGRLWLAGVEVDWCAFHSRERRRRIPLPTYPFERQRYWIQRTKPSRTDARLQLNRFDKNPDVAKWFYVPGWSQSSLPIHRGPAQISSTWLALVDDSQLARDAVRLLAGDGDDVVHVTRGASFTTHDEHHYSINPGSSTDFAALVESLAARGLSPERIVNFWPLDNRHAAQPLRRRIAPALENGLYSILSLIQAFGARSAQPLEIAIVTHGVTKVMEDDRLAPENATLIGACRVIPQEFPEFACKIIDIGAEGSGTPPVRVRTLVGELTSGRRDALVAYRGGRRWVQSFEPLTLERSALRACPFTDRGAYLITGGLGGIGLAIAEHLSRTVRARLVLVGRSGLPPRAEWDAYLRDAVPGDRLAERIWQVRAMEDRGSEVLIVPANVADADQMRRALEQAQQRFGGVDGVVHAAGVPAAGLMQLKSRETIERVLTPKVHGTAVLDELLADQDVKTVVLISSMTSVTGGGPGQLDYCAANAFLDAYAQACSAGERFVVSIDWGEWQWNAWQEGLAGFDASIQQLFRDHREKVGISFPEGMDALERAVATGLPQLVVSTQDFAAVIEASKTFTVEKLLRESEARRESESRHPRPVLGTPYAAPRNDVERTLAGIWQQLLGVDRVGIHDNFFELGGHSLLAMQIFSRVRRVYDVTFSLREMFDAPTIATQGEMLSAILWATRSPGDAPPNERELVVEGEV